MTNREILAVKGILLKTSGYAYLEKASLKEDCQELKDYLETIPLTKDSNRTIISSWKTLKSFKIVQRICSDSSVKHIMDDYLKCDSIINGIVAWKTLPRNNNRITLSKDAMQFHFDCDHNRFTKLLIYLDEVDNECGPHVFIPNTSATERECLPALLHRDGRFTSTEIVNSGLCPESVFGRAGTIVFADTHNLHRGTPVRNDKARYILSIQFVDSVAGATPIHQLKDILEMNNFYS